MTQKFNYDGYTICLAFRTDNAFSVTASHNLTGEMFINQMVELGKIKKDTVLATLSRKTEKNLWCTFKMSQLQTRTLTISFVVKFDYLPEFSQDITLDFVEVKGQIFNKISSAELRSDITQTQKVLDAIKYKGPLVLEQKTTTVSKKTELTNFNLNQGTYLLKITGFIVNTSTQADVLLISIKPQGEEEVVLRQKSYTNSSYGYPFFFSHKLESKGGNVEISVSNSGTTASLSSEIITLVPISGTA